MTYPLLPYIVTEVYCVIFAITVWVRLDNTVGSEHEIQQLRYMIYSYLAMLCTDIIWALGEDHIIRLDPRVYAFDNAITIIAISCGCYFWFRFIEDRLHFSDKRLDFLVKIPLFVICTLHFLSIFTGWIFYIDAGGHYQSTRLFDIMGFINYFYLVVPTIYSIYRAVRTHVKQERHEYLTYALYMVGPLIAAILEETFPTVPLLALNIFLMILILFMMIQNMQVYNDALTGLNNRRRFNQHLEECMGRAANDHPVTLFIMDINSFKSINDAFGHLEGDIALKTFAQVLEEQAFQHRAFAARYGGDEFCLLMENRGCVPEEVIREIQGKLLYAQMKQKRENVQYRFTVSVGYTVCKESGYSSAEMIKKADEMLYDNKQKWHIKNR